MKSFVKKVAALAVVFSMASSTLANAQEEDGKVNAERKSKVDDNTAKMQSIKWLGV